MFSILKLLTRASALAALAALATATLGVSAQEAPQSIRIGWSLAKSGVNAGGSDTTVRPNYEMWVKEVNAAGGIFLKAFNKRVPVTVVEYDDRSSTEEAVRAIERLITQDKVDLVLPPWGTAVNLAVAPTLARHGYPQIAATALTDRIPDLTKRWQTIYFMLGRTSSYVDSLLTYLEAARKEGKIGDTIAMVNIADGFGVELATAMRLAAPQRGFKLVYDKSYPIGSQDLSPMLNEIKALKPEVFVAFSYPPDSVLIVEQSRVLSLNPKAFFTGVGTNFPFFRARFAAAAEGLLSVGGIQGDDPKVRDYLQRHQAATGKLPDNWGSLSTYASLQVLQQAIERVGRIDRAAINNELRAGSFDTILGNVKFDNQVFGRIFMVGQWQQGVFQGVAPADQPGAKPAFVAKPAWQ